MHSSARHHKKSLFYKNDIHHTKQNLPDFFYVFPLSISQRFRNNTEGWRVVSFSHAGRKSIKRRSEPGVHLVFFLFPSLASPYFLFIHCVLSSAGFIYLWRRPFFLLCCTNFPSCMHCVEVDGWEASSFFLLLLLLLVCYVLKQQRQQHLINRVFLFPPTSFDINYCRVLQFPFGAPPSSSFSMFSLPF